MFPAARGDLARVWLVHSARRRFICSISADCAAMISSAGCLISGLVARCSAVHGLQTLRCGHGSLRN